jgi:threonine/homoserine/homoserine lactone efflux protein
VPILQHILAFALAAVLIVIVPGPNMSFLIHCAINQGKKTAILALLGSNTALLTLGLLTGLGLNSLLKAVPIVYDVLKVSGAFYFFWLAYKSIFLSKERGDEKDKTPEYGAKKAFQNGYLTNILNPKAAAFYIAIFPQFFIPKLGYLVIQGLVLSLIHALVSFTINNAIIYSVSQMAVRIKASSKVQNLKKWGSAIIFTAFGIRMLMQKNN